MKNALTLFLMFFLGIQAYAQDANDVLMRVGGKAVTVGDFMYAYQKNGQGNQEGLDKFLEGFQNNNLKIAYAEKLGLDTLASVRQQMNYLQKTMEAGQNISNAESGFDGLHGLSLYIGHLLLPLPQHSPNYNYQYELKVRMDSIYNQIVSGEDFMAVINAVSPNTRNEYWISKTHTLQEVENQAYRLNEGEMSKPFLDYDGYHLIKVLKKSEQADIKNDQPAFVAGQVDTHLLAEYRNGLILNELYKIHSKEEKEATEQELSAFFTAMHGNYEWDIPRFKGALYFCKDKKTQKELVKLLKKVPMKDWERLAKSQNYTELFENVEMGPVKLYMLSQDPYVDELAFKGPKQKSRADFPIHGVMGKKLKKSPEDYTDVRDQVLQDFELAQELQWMENIKKEIPINVDMKVFKRIKK